MSMRYYPVHEYGVLLKEREDFENAGARFLKSGKGNLNFHHTMILRVSLSFTKKKDEERYVDLTDETFTIVYPKKYPEFIAKGIYLTWIGL